MDGEFAYDESGINRFTYKLAALLIVATALVVLWTNLDWGQNEVLCGGDPLDLLEPGDPCYSRID